MAHGFHRAMEIMGWRVPAEEDDYEAPAEPAPEAREFTLESVPGGAGPAETPSLPRFDRRVTTERSGGGLRRISTVHPRSFDDALQIGESFRDGVPVIMNLSDLPDSEARRVVDFAAGLTFGLEGSIERVTSRVFLLTPKNIEVDSNERQPSAAYFG